MSQTFAVHGRERRPRWKPLRAGPGTLAVLLAAAMMSGSARAQSVDCESLRAQVEDGVRESETASERADDLRQQTVLLERARAYADSLGCGGGIFDDPDSAECQPIAQRVRRLEDNVARLRVQARAWNAGQDQRRALSDRLGAQCSTPRPAEPAGVYDGSGVMRGDDAPPDPETAPTGPSETGDQPQIMAEPDETSASPKPSKALCVRECDGAFFPLAYHVTPEQLDGLAHLCQAQCPNTRASLYTTDPAGEIDTAVAADGSAYTTLPAAFKYRQSFDATCSCKRPGQTWTDALAAAEGLIERDKNDVTVTQQMSDALSRPETSRGGGLAPAQAKGGQPPSRRIGRRDRGGLAPVAPPSAGTAPGVPAEPSGNPGEDLTRQIRTNAPAP